MSLCLSDAELSALRGLPYFVRCLYVLAIRPYMDFRTGLVGLGPRISYRALAEALYVEPHQGQNDAGPPHTSRLKRAVTRLETTGLVINRSIVTPTAKQLIFFLPLAATDTSARKKPGPNPNHSPGPQPEPDARYTSYLNSSHYFNFREKPGPQPEPVKTENPVSPPISDRSLSECVTPLPPAPCRAVPEETVTTEAERFDEFWNAWPSGYRIGRKPCQARWSRLRLDPLADSIIADVQRRQRDDRGWLNGYIPNPLTYLTQARWNDDIRPVKNPARGPKPFDTFPAARPGSIKSHEDATRGHDSQVVESRGGDVMERQLAALRNYRQQRHSQRERTGNTGHDDAGG
jgi:hypothetical protein